MKKKSTRQCCCSRHYLLYYKRISLQCEDFNRHRHTPAMQSYRHKKEITKSFLFNLDFNLKTILEILNKHCNEKIRCAFHHMDKSP